MHFQAKLRGHRCKRSELLRPPCRLEVLRMVLHWGGIEGVKQMTIHMDDEPILEGSLFDDKGGGLEVQCRDSCEPNSTTDFIATVSECWRHRTG